MPQIKYLRQYDELEIIFKESSVTETYTLSNGVILEFDEDGLSYIIMPYFSRNIRMIPPENAVFEYKDIVFDDLDSTIIIKMNDKTINIKISFIDIEN